MKNTLIYLSLLLCFAAISFTAQAQTKDEQAVAAAVETLRKAMIDGDKATLENITLDELTYGHSSGKLETKAEYVEALASGKSNFESMDLTAQTITVVGNTALVRHDLKAHVVDNGKPADVHLGVLLVWQKPKRSLETTGPAGI